MCQSVIPESRRSIDKGNDDVEGEGMEGLRHDHTGMEPFDMSDGKQILA
jgi:hypothetical protein